jgi:hypothetical protein
MDSAEWQGANPFYLMFVKPLEEGSDVPLVEIVDLDRSGWLADQGSIFRSPGDLYLVRKEGRSVALSVHVLEGEQSYYVARHVGIAGGVGVSKNEVTAYGIGKKRVDGNEDNLWLLPWGQICGGRDVEYFAIQGLKKGFGQV